MPGLFDDIAEWLNSGATVRTRLAATQGPSGLFRAIANPDAVMNSEPANLGSGFLGGMGGIVKPAVARALKTAQALPAAPEFRQAVANTPGAQLAGDGLLMHVMRNQLPEQALEDSVRGGVFYLPEGAAQGKHYSTGKNGYGGSEKISGETLLQNPLLAKGGTGGKAPQAAYDSLLGKGSYENMRTDALNVQRWIPGAHRPDTGAMTEQAYKFLEKYAPEMSHLADHIVTNSGKGNQLAYALQEAAVGSAVRGAGHDAVLGYSKGKKGPFLSEIFDVRERNYPDKFGTQTSIWDAFK